MKSNPKEKRKQSKFWFFTAHTSHVSEETVQQTIQASYESGKLLYCVYNLESAPTTGGIHLQGHCVLKRSQDRGAAQRILGIGKSDCEVTLDVAGAERYCRKEATRVEGTEPWSIGTLPQSRQGERTDLSELYEFIKTAESKADVLDAFPTEFIMYNRGVNDALSTSLSRRQREQRHVEVQVFWGKTRMGKTRRAMFENPDFYNLSVKNDGSRVWWDGYNGQSCVIIDEFKGNMPIKDLLKLTDPYPIENQGEVKGGHVLFKWTKIVITSNYHPRDWYKPKCHPNYEYDESPLQKRLEVEGQTIHFESEWLPPTE